MPIINETTLTPIDYLIIGNITQDLTESGPKIGGTATFSGLTAHNMGMRVGVVTSAGNAANLEALEELQVHLVESRHSTTFKNIHTANGRIQYLYQQAASLSLLDIPPLWLQSPIIHLGPIFNEVDLDIINAIPTNQLFMTPQGWLRRVDEVGRIHSKVWQFDENLIAKASAIVISNEDIQDDEVLIEELARLCQIVVVTENQIGVRVYWNRDLRRFSAPETPYVEDTGAGDIFAAAFFCRLHQTNDPWTAAKFAMCLSSASVSRSHLLSIPTKDEINAAIMEVIQ